jgi:hypothetical protein
MDHLLFSGSVALSLIFLLVVGALSIFWLWMLIHAAFSRKLSPIEKIIWVLVIFFGHFIGALIYYILGRATRVL